MAAVGLAAANAGAGMLRQSMNADGMNYLDMGDAFMRGDWAVAINGTWSPLYGFILGLTMELAKPPIEWEFPTVHAVNFVIFLVALVSFEFFWRRATDAYYRQETDDPDGRVEQLPRWAWFSVGYGLFIWSSFALIEIYSVTPDMFVAACVFLATGLVLRIGGSGATWRRFALLGIVLGVGYLAKAVMFPLAFVFLAAAVLAQRAPLRGTIRMLPALATFLIVSGPLLTALSMANGRFTFSEVGKLTYLKHVHEVPFPHWRPGVVEVAGAPEHGVRTIGQDPTIYEFATPVGGTYPLSYDPYYWYKGLVPSVDIPKQSKALAVNLRFYFDLFLRAQGMFFGVAIVLVAVALLDRPDRSPYAGWPLLLISSAALGAYALVHVWFRYVAPFVVLLWAAVLLSIRLKAKPAQRRWLTVSGGVLVFSVVVNIAAFHVEGLNALVRFVPSSGGLVGGGGGRTASASPPDVARGLVALGLREGDQVGFIGYSFDAYWARLARLKIIAEIVPEEADEFWNADSDMQGELLRRFSAAGVKAVVAQRLPREGPMPPGWTEVGATGFFVYVLSGTAARG
jgi:hypothetical protein